MAGRRDARDLPHDLDLPLQSGRDWWYWTGGRPAIDFVNTLRERWRRQVECLCSSRDLADWLVRAGLLQPGGDAATGDLATAIAMREAIDGALVAAVAERTTPPSAVDTINEVLGRHQPPRLELRGDSPVLSQRPPVDSVPLALTLVARDAANLLGIDAERRRIRICAAVDCSARFYDRSPAARRRWCSMAGCGNRNNVRAHRRRTSTQETHDGIRGAAG